MVYEPKLISDVCGDGPLTNVMCFNTLYAPIVFLCGGFGVDNGLYMFSLIVWYLGVWWSMHGGVICGYRLFVGCWVGLWEG